MFQDTFFSRWTLQLPGDVHCTWEFFGTPNIQKKPIFFSLLENNRKSEARWESFKILTSSSSLNPPTTSFISSYGTSDLSGTSSGCFSCVVCVDCLNFYGLKLKKENYNAKKEKTLISLFFPDYLFYYNNHNCHSSSSYFNFSLRHLSYFF